MTNIQENDAFVREKLGKKCKFSYEKETCFRGILHSNIWVTRPICPHCHGTGFEPIGLADVLMGLGHNIGIDYIECHSSGNGFYFRIKESDEDYLRWNLTKSYDEQEESVRISIGELIKD